MTNDYNHLYNIVQSAGTTPNETEVTNSIPPPLYCVNMSKIYIYCAVQ
jgi:hypothetical protein